MAKVAFSAEIQDLRGKIGNTVFTRARNGATVRARVNVSNPRTSAQTAVRANLARASAAYKNMTPAQVQAWRAYASTQTRRDPITGASYTPAANTVFTGLASKFLQNNPAGAIPVTPPASAFGGDALTVIASEVNGTVLFEASGPDTANVKTELLLQPLKSQNRTPTAKGYRTRAFVAFAAGALDHNVPVPNGFYVPAYRFINALTGQDTELVTLPVVEVV